MHVQPEATNVFARVDHRIGARNQLAVRYNLYDVSSENSRTVGGLNSISRGSNLDNVDHTLSVNNVTTVSPRLINELRLLHTRSRLEAPVNDEVGPAVNISGVASFGTATFSPLGRDIDLFQVNDSVSTQRGARAIKAGIDFLLNRVDVLFPGAFQGVYTFSSLDNFRAGRYINFQQAFGKESRVSVESEPGPFRPGRVEGPAFIHPKRGLALRRSMAARSDSDRPQQHVAEAGHRVFAERSQDRDQGRRRRLL